MRVTTQNPTSLPINESSLAELRARIKVVGSKRNMNNPVTIIMIDGRTLRFESGNQNGINMLINTQPPAINTELQTTEQPIMNQYIGISTIKQGRNSAYMSITDENGIDVAYFDKKHNDLYVPYNPFELPDKYAIRMITDVFALAMDIITEEEQRVRMWSDETRESLRETIATQLAGVSAENIQSLKSDLRSQAEGEELYRNRLQRAILQQQQLMKRIELAENQGNELDEKIYHEFDFIVKNPDVEKLEVLEDKIVIHTHPIRGMSDQGKFYNFGEYQITYTFSNTDIKYTGSEKRHGYWTSEDPHPHVDGSTGRPCLGNVSEAIVQLGAEREYAALAMVAIEFLKAANTSDPAGKNVVRWDEVDENGTIIKEGIDIDERECDSCGDTYATDELEIVFNNADADEFWEEAEVCEGCSENVYIFSDVHEVRLHENNPSEAFEYEEEEEEEDDEE